MPLCCLVFLSTLMSCLVVALQKHIPWLVMHVSRVWSIGSTHTAVLLAHSRPSSHFIISICDYKVRNSFNLRTELLSSRICCSVVRESELRFRRNISHPSSRSRSKQRNEGGAGSEHSLRRSLSLSLSLSHIFHLYDSSENDDYCKKIKQP
jgi:hypothetical protein